MTESSATALFEALVAAYRGLDFPRVLDLAKRLDAAGLIHPIQAVAMAHAGHAEQDLAAYLRGLAIIDEVAAADPVSRETLEKFAVEALEPLAQRATLTNEFLPGIGLYEIIRRSTAANSTPLPPALDRHDNEPITDADLERCRGLTDELKRMAQPSTDLWAELGANSEQPVHAENFLSEVAIDREFLETLRGRASMFSGFPLSALTLGPAEAFAFSRLHRQMTAGLPRDLIFSLPPKGGNRGFMIDDLCVNMDTISYQERVTLLHVFGALERVARSERPVILEIGGGFGALAYFLTRRFPDALYVIVDLPESLVYSGCHLALTLADTRITVGPDCDSRRSIALVPYQSLDRLPAIGIDLAINTLSFGEMSEEIVERYARFLKQRLAPGGVLFEQNYALKPLGRNFSNPKTILARWFDFQATCTATTWRGAASLWGGREFFTPGFDWPLGNPS